MRTVMSADAWPELPLEAWQDTYATLHRWTQVVGKVRLALAPPVNHSWHVTLYATCRGLTTGPVPYGALLFEMEFDFVEHRLHVRTSGGDYRSLPLVPMPVAEFYRGVLETLDGLGIEVHIRPEPSEIPDALPLDEDTLHAAYDPEYARRCWQVLLQAHRVLSEFRGGFIGKASPVHFFWGSFDLAVTRFSGRPAPPHPGGIPNLPDRVTREAYSHEVSSCGFWPGGGPVPMPVFYAYAYPEPPGFPDFPVEPQGAVYNRDLREFVLPYELIRTARDPEGAILAFCRSTYEAAADLGRWDRASLERPAL